MENQSNSFLAKVLWANPERLVQRTCIELQKRQHIEEIHRSAKKEGGFRNMQ